MLRILVGRRVAEEALGISSPVEQEGRDMMQAYAAAYAEVPAEPG